jgi:hypothetical protein
MERRRGSGIKSKSKVLSGTVSRRDVLSSGLCGSAAVLLAHKLGVRASSAAVRPAKAKSIIQIWMWGGPSHLDTFDPKPDAGYDYCGPLTNPLETNVKGIRIGELLPNMSKQADKYSIIRSMTHEA